MLASRLTPGGTIGICSPSCIPNREEYTYVCLDKIRALGYVVREADNLYSDTYGYLATPEERAADFNLLVADPYVQLILFNGGEGAGELLPLIDFDALKKNPKLICSYSDGTSILNPVWANTGLVVYYGFSPAFFANLSIYNHYNFIAHLVRGGVTEMPHNSPWLTKHGGCGRGTLVGGYLRNFAMLLGSKYFPIHRDRDYILFLEDHEMFGDTAYVSAMLSYIEQSGFFDSVRGLLFGHYSKTPHPELYARIGRIGEKYGIPAVYCDDFGHGDNHAILPIGTEAELDADAQTLRFI